MPSAGRSPIPQAFEPASVISDDWRDSRIVHTARNIPGVAVTTAQRVNVYELLRYPRIVVARDAFETLLARLGQPQEAAK